VPSPNSAERLPNGHTLVASQSARRVVELDGVRLYHAGDTLADEQILRKAVDLLVESAEPIDPEKAKTRDKIWTPEKQRKGEGSAQLWTPSDRNVERPVDAPADAGKQS